MRALPIGSEALTVDDMGRVIRVTIIRHGRDSEGVYTVARNALGRDDKYHRDRLHPIAPGSMAEALASQMLPEDPAIQDREDAAEEEG